MNYLFSNNRLKLILFLFVVIYLTFNLISTQFDLMTKKQEYNNLAVRKQQIELEIADTHSLLNESSDSKYIERFAREKLGYAYAGEVVYIDIQSE